MDGSGSGKARDSLFSRRSRESKIYLHPSQSDCVIIHFSILFLFLSLSLQGQRSDPTHLQLYNGEITEDFLKKALRLEIDFHEINTTAKCQVDSDPSKNSDPLSHQPINFPGAELINSPPSFLTHI